MTKWKRVETDVPKEKKRDMGCKKRRIWAFVPLVAVIMCAVGALIWALPRLPLKPQTQSGASYQGVVELWNVESFEGGVGSREAWLKGRSALFEKDNSGLFVHVTTLTEQQLQSKLNEGERCDIVCFSRGVGNIVKESILPFNGSVANVRDNFLVSGQINGVQYAVPLYSGAYCLFARAEMLSGELLPSALTQTYTRKVGKTTVELSPLVCGFTPYNSPLSALAMSGGRGNVSLDESTTQYQAYEQFVANRTAVTLLGTQRDMYRLSQKEANGKIESLTFAPLTGYTDLVQYIAVATDGDKADACVKYVEFLLSEQTQSTLANMCLFSVTEQNFYTAERYSAVETGLSTAYVPNVFGDSQAIARQRDMAKQTLAI